MKKKVELKLRAIFLLLAIVSSSLIYAQPPGGGQKGGQQGPPPIPNEKQIEKMVSELASEISLTETQEEQVLDIYINHFADVEEKTKEGRPGKSEMDELKANFENSVKALLDTNQQEQYTTYMQNNKAQRGGKRK